MTDITHATGQHVRQVRRILDSDAPVVARELVAGLLADYDRARDAAAALRAHGAALREVVAQADRVANAYWQGADTDDMHDLMRDLETVRHRHDAAVAGLSATTTHPREDPR